MIIKLVKMRTLNIINSITSNHSITWRVNKVEFVTSFNVYATGFGGRTGGTSAARYFSKDILWIITKPGPVSVVLNNPSPPQHIVQQPPVLWSPNFTDSWNPTIEFVSTINVSPGESS